MKITMSPGQKSVIKTFIRAILMAALGYFTGQSIPLN